MELTELDRWALSRMQATIEIVRERMDEFDATVAGRAIATFVEEISNWYVRRSRRRFWDGDPAAFATLRECLLTVSKLLAPFCPFISDELYDNLDGSEPSVHVCDFPVAGPREAELEEVMSVARQTVRLGSGRAQQGQGQGPPAAARGDRGRDGLERAAIERTAEIIRDELNVRELRFVSEVDELGEVEVKPNYRTLGPGSASRCRWSRPPSRDCSPPTPRAALREGRTVAITIGGQDHELAVDDLLVAMKPLEGYEVEREGSHAVALELELDDELRAEGLGQGDRSRRAGRPPWCRAGGL